MFILSLSFKIDAKKEQRPCFYVTNLYKTDILQLREYRFPFFRSIYGQTNKIYRFEND